MSDAAASSGATPMSGVPLSVWLRFAAGGGGGGRLRKSTSSDGAEVMTSASSLECSGRCAKVRGAGSSGGRSSDHGSRIGARALRARWTEALPAALALGGSTGAIDARPTRVEGGAAIELIEGGA